MKYNPFGTARSGSVPTDKKFTGQRLDGTGLYYYGARYYDPVIGRFVSADTVVQDFKNPQMLNRYSYVLNNPLKYADPTGHWVQGFDNPDDLEAAIAAGLYSGYEKDAAETFVGLMEKDPNFKEAAQQYFDNKTQWEFKSSGKLDLADAKDGSFTGWDFGAKGSRPEGPRPTPEQARQGLGQAMKIGGVIFTGASLPSFNKAFIGAGLLTAAIGHYVETLDVSLLQSTLEGLGFPEYIKISELFDRVGLPHNP